jgi:methylphosphotriester-DNA--protein-cysteine methyltransferase
MTRHDDFENNEAGKKQLLRLIRQNKIVLGGNSKLRIYGSLHCNSGKRMLRKNRVFFRSEKDAIANGYRPCGYCMKEKYFQWKNKKM